MPSARRFGAGPGGPQKPGSGRSGGVPRRGLSHQERDELLSEPPEHHSSDRLDSIGIEHEGGGAHGRRRPSDRRSSKVVSQSQRERHEQARAQVRKLIPVGIGLLVLALIGVACMIPGMIRKDRLGRLGKADAFAREEAATLLGHSGSAISDLASLAGSGDFERSGGAAALALSMSRDGFQALSRLAGLGGEPGAKARRAAAYGLGLTGRADAVPVLEKLLLDEDPNIRKEAVQALGRIHAPAAVKALLDQGGASAVVRDLAMDLVLDASQGCPEAVPELVKGLSSPTAEVRSAAGRALVALDKVPSESELKTLIESKSPAVKAGAIEFLGLAGGAIFDEVVPRALSDSAPEVRRAAAAAAGLRRWDKGAEALEKLAVAADEPAEVRAEAAKALGRIARLESVVPLARMVADAKLAEPARKDAARAIKGIAKLYQPECFHAPNENNDRLTHLKLAARKSDLRWPAIETLVAGCDSFSAGLAPDAFAALNALTWRELAPKAEVWKGWFLKKQDEAKALGEASYYFELASAQKTVRGQENKAVENAFKAQDIVAALRDKCDPDDKSFYAKLYGDVSETLKGAARPAESAPAPAPAAPAPAAEPKKE